MGDCDQDLQSRGISIAVTIRLIVRLIPTYGCREREELDFAALGVIRHCTPPECGRVGALCSIDIALFQSANIRQVVG